MCILIFVWLRGKIHIGEWCCEVVGSCEVQFSTHSQPDKNLYVCVCMRLHSRSCKVANSCKNMVLRGCGRLRGSISYFLEASFSQMNAEAANDLYPKY